MRHLTTLYIFHCTHCFPGLFHCRVEDSDQGTKDSKKKKKKDTEPRIILANGEGTVALRKCSGMTKLKRGQSFSAPFLCLQADCLHKGDWLSCTSSPPMHSNFFFTMPSFFEFHRLSNFHNATDRGAETGPFEPKIGAPEYLGVDQ